MARLLRDNRAVVKVAARVALEGVKRDVAERIVYQAQRRVPVDTGELRDSIGIEEGTAGKVSVVAGAGHAIYVEAGTTRMAAQPFLVPAALFVRALLPSIARRSFPDAKIGGG